MFIIYQKKAVYVTKLPILILKSIPFVMGNSN